jgi:simple sugar transport system substrate-binding protein
MVEEPVGKLPGEGMVIYFQMGGEPGGPASDPALGGARLAAELWGCELVVQAGKWDMELHVAQFREAVAAKPDGIVILGMMGEEPSRPILEDALDLGIIVTGYHWGFPTFEKEFKDQGFANFWMDFSTTGIAHAQATIDGAGLKAGDRVLLYDHIGPDPRILITEGIVDTLEEAGITVDWIVNPAEQILSVDYASSIVAGYIAAHPDTDAIMFWHGVFTAEAETILRAAGVTDPDEIWVTGADINPDTIEALESGYLDLIGDGQLSLQAFLAVQQIVLTKLYKYPGHSVYLTPVHHNWESMQEIIPLIEKGLR